MPTRLPAPPATDPTPVYRHRDGLYAADLVTAGLVWLDVFTLARSPAVRPRRRSAPASASTPRPADVMVTLFAAMGLVVRDGGTIRLTPLAREHFVADSPYSLRGLLRVVQGAARLPRPRRGAADRQARPGWASTKPNDWLTAMLDPAFADGFTAAMDSRGLYLGPAAARGARPGGAPRPARHRRRLRHLRLRVRRPATRT